MSRSLGHILYGVRVTTDEVNPSTTYDSASRGFQRRDNAAWCWKSSSPRRGSSDCGSSALGNKQLVKSSHEWPLTRSPIIIPSDVCGAGVGEVGRKKVI